MKFTIFDLLLTTAVIGILFALLRLNFDFFVILQLCMPFVMIFTTIVFADQRGQTLDRASNPTWQLMKKFWLLSFVCGVVPWAIIAAMYFAGIPIG